MTLKRIVILFLCVICIGTFVFAGGGRERGADGRTTLNFWSWRTEDVAAYERLFRVFEQRNPNIRVNNIAYRNTDYNAILMAALAAGSGPDVFMARAHGGMEGWAQSGFMVPLDDLVPELRYFSADSRLMSTSVTTGRIYGVPMASQAKVIFYNVDIYNRLGLSHPVTWDDFIGNMRTIRNAGIIPIGNGGRDGWVLETMMGNLGPNFYGANEFYYAVRAGTRTFEDPAFITALEKIHSLQPYMPPMMMGIGYDDGRALFVNEQAAHFIGGTYDAAFWDSENPRLRWNIFLPPVARAGDRSYISVYGDGSYAMNPATSHFDESLTLLRFFAGRETGEMHVRDLQWITAVPGIDTSTSPFINRVMELKRYTTPHMFLVGFRFGTPSGSVELQAAMQGMFGGEIDAPEAARRIQAAIATWHTPFQR